MTVNKKHLAVLLGALAIALVGWTWMKKVGLSSLVSLGDMADVDFPDSIEYFGNDPKIDCIALYVEGAKNGRKFMEACQKIAPTKPIVALKAGVSRRGMMATISHTGSLAGSRRVYEAAFKQSGVTMADTLEDGRLVVVEANRHTGYGDNDCVTDVVHEYLVQLIAPEDGTVCS